MTQESFSVLFGSPKQSATEHSRPFQTDKEAMQARNARYKELKNRGVKATRYTLSGQLRQYWSMGRECGRFCNVYYLDY